MALLAHLLGIVTGPIGALVIWLINKDDASKGFVTDQSKEALNFQITIVIAAVISGMLVALLIGLLLLPAVGIIDLIFCIIAGLKANGTHGFHIHEKGDCSAADFTSAGGHFNPTAQPHGRASQGAHHLGDQDNLTANANGVARVDAHFDGAVIGSGAALNDVVGKAVIVHADPDDYTTQPTGNAGGRIACGVIR